MLQSDAAIMIGKTNVELERAKNSKLKEFDVMLFLIVERFRDEFFNKKAS